MPDPELPDGPAVYDNRGRLRPVFAAPAAILIALVILGIAFRILNFFL